MSQRCAGQSSLASMFIDLRISLCVRSGFDPLGLSRPSEFVLIGVDGQDQNLAQNQKGTVEAVVTASPDEVSSENRLSPYSEVFGLARFRECEIIHGRWAMMACLGAIVGEAVTGVSWLVHSILQQYKHASCNDSSCPVRLL